MSIERRVIPLSDFRPLTYNGDKPKLEGYVVKWETLSNPIPRLDGKPGTFHEYFMQGAFRDTIKDDEQLFLVGHNRSTVYGSTKDGTLRLREDRQGLHFELDVTERNKPLYEAVKAGRLNSMSFAFQALDDEFFMHKGVYLRTVRRVKLAEISAVREPAHRDTSINVAMSNERKKLLLKAMTI